MCTVTIVPSRDALFITHSRDESSARPKAIPPALYQVNDYSVLFPKDVKGGGTWIAVNENGSAAVLLNGAFIRHVPQPPYRKSRGLILLDIVSSPDIWPALQTLDLTGIEPFTTITWDNNALFEIKWNGTSKHIRLLDHLQSHIWSSTTLYDPEARVKRESWFSSWRNQNPDPDIHDIIRFHREGGEGDPVNDLCMNRGDDCLQTVSISALEIAPEKALMKYLDLNGTRWHQQQITFNKSPVENL